MFVQDKQVIEQELLDEERRSFLEGKMWKEKWDE